MELGSSWWCPAMAQEEGAQIDGQEFHLDVRTNFFPALEKVLRVVGSPRWGYPRLVWTQSCALKLVSRALS